MLFFLNGSIFLAFKLQIVIFLCFAILLINNNTFKYTKVVL